LDTRHPTSEDCSNTTMGPVPSEDFDLVENFFEEQLSVAARTPEERARWAMNDMNSRMFCRARRPLSVARRDEIEEKFSGAFNRQEDD